MSQPSISVDSHGRGTVLTDRSIVLYCERRDDNALPTHPETNPECCGKVIVTLGQPAVCERCGQTYTVELSG